MMIPFSGLAMESVHLELKSKLDYCNMKLINILCEIYTLYKCIIYKEIVKNDGKASENWILK